MNKNPFLSSNKYVPHTFSHDPPKLLNPSSSQQHTLKALLRGQITGKSFSSVRHLSAGFFSETNLGSQAKPFNSLANLVVELEDSLNLRDNVKCEKCLVEISKKLSELTSPFYSDNRDWFIQLSGIGLLVRCLEFPPPSPSRIRTRAMAQHRRSTNPQNLFSHSDWMERSEQNSFKIRNQCMALLRELCFTHPNVGQTLSQNDRLITFLFTLLEDAKTFDASIGILEEILGAKADTFDLSLVPGFNNLVKGMTKSQLGIFCRVLAMVVFEPDDRNGDEIISSLELLRSRKRGRHVTLAVRNIDRNHAIVLGIPNLLERLVKLLRGTNHPDSRMGQFPSVSDLLAIYHAGRNGIANNEDGDEDDEEDDDEEDDDMEDEDEEDEVGEAVDAMDIGDTTPHYGNGNTNTSGNGGRQLTTTNENANVNTTERRRPTPGDALAAIPGLDAEMDNGLRGIAAQLMANLGVGADAAVDIRALYNMDHELEALMDGTAQTLKALALSTYQVELLFVLYALLAGKRKAELQDRLAGLGLIHTATVLFDNTDWLKPPPPMTTHNHNHNPHYECHPDAALKIQLLRLILNFCDGDFENRHNKRLLLSREEIATLHAATPTLGVTYGVGLSNARLSAGTGPGLLTKLINVFYKLPQEQNNRFWMASCIEAFLRGSEPVFQRFVAKSGMLSYLIKEIVSDEPRVQGSLQTSFDLLGELMKFNREIFAQFNEELVGEKAMKFFANVMTHLVDSNVFLRGMVLSIEKFREEDTKALSTTPDSYFSFNPSSSSSSSTSTTTTHTPYPFSTCKIAQFLSQHWFKLVKDLMTVVSIDAINQENICCVNTTMVFCIYARRKDQLRHFVQTTRAEEEAYKNTLGSKALLPTSVPGNFQKLLWFWHEYYLLRGKDSLSLEYTSRIPFSEWTATYDLLVDELGQFDPTGFYEQWEVQKKVKKESVQ